MNKPCANCNTPVNGKYCDSCGQKRFSGRITVKGTLAEAVQGIFNVERGLWYTMKELTIRPGRAISRYVQGAIKSYYNPFKYLLLAATIGTLSNFLISTDMDSAFFQTDNITVNGTSVDLVKIVLEYVFDHYVLFTVSFLPVLALVSALFFYRKQRNLAESIVYNAYLLGHYTLLYALIGVGCILLGADVMSVTSYSSVFLFIYYTWAAREFYKVTWLGSLWRNILILTFGYFGSIAAGMVITVLYLNWSGALPVPIQP